MHLLNHDFIFVTLPTACAKSMLGYVSIFGVGDKNRLPAVKTIPYPSGAFHHGTLTRVISGLVCFTSRRVARQRDFIALRPISFRRFADSLFVRVLLSS